MPRIIEEPFVKRQLNKIGEENLRDLILLIRADTIGRSAARLENRLKEIIEFEALLDEVIATEPCFTPKHLAVNDDDLIDIGYESGKEIGVALSLLLNAVIDGKCENSKDALLEYLRRR